MNLHPEPLHEPIPIKALIPKSPGTRSQRINPLIATGEATETICRTAAGYEIKAAQIKPTFPSYRVLPDRSPRNISAWCGWIQKNRGLMSGF